MDAQQWLTTAESVCLRVLAASEAKGLEFDAVAVVDPARVLTESRTELRRLYVVLTRATGLFTTVGAEDWLGGLPTEQSSRAGL